MFPNLTLKYHLNIMYTNSLQDDKIAKEKKKKKHLLVDMDRGDQDLYIGTKYNITGPLL